METQEELENRLKELGHLIGPFKLKESFPELYDYFINRARYLLSPERRPLVESIVDSVNIIFAVDPWISQGEASFRIERRVINITLPSDFTVQYGELNLNSVKEFMSKNRSYVGSVIHELAHSVQDFFSVINELKTIYEYPAKEKNPFELSAILENIWYYKKQGLTLKDFLDDRVKRLMRYVLTSMLKVDFSKPEEAQKKIIDHLYLKQDINAVELSKMKLSDLIKALKKDIEQHVIARDTSAIMAQKYWDKVSGIRQEVPKHTFAIDMQLRKIANGLEWLGLYQEASDVDWVLKVASVPQEIQFNQVYLFKELLPELYNNIYPRVKALLGGDKENIKNKLELLPIVFINSVGYGFEYNLNTKTVEVRLPSYILDKVKTDNNTMDYMKLKSEISNDFILSDGAIHELIHSLQGIGYENKEDYIRQRKTIPYDNVTYERDAAIESLLIAKKLGLKFEDIERSLQYHLWSSFKKDYGVLDDMEDLKNLKNNGNDSIMIKNRITKKINMVLRTDDIYEDAIRAFKEYFKTIGYKIELGKVAERAISIWNKKYKNKRQSFYTKNEMLKIADSFNVLGLIKYARKIQDTVVTEE